MDKQNNNRNDFLWTLLANPANDARLHAADLQHLVNAYPQSGILQALFAHASEEKNLKRAAAYFNSQALFKLINSPSGFISVPNENIIIQTNIPANSYHELVPVTEDEAAYPEKDNGTENHFNDHSAIETEGKQYEQIEEHRPVVDERHLIEQAPEVEGYIEEFAESKIPAENKVSGPEEVVPSNTILAVDGGEKHGETEQSTHKFEHNELAIEEGTVEEHNEEVPSNTVLAYHEPVINFLAGDDGNVEVKDENREETMAYPDSAKQPLQAADEEETYDEITGIEDIHIKPTALAGSAFALEKEFDEHKPTDNNREITQADHIINQTPDILTGDVVQSDLSKYHDEKMPYTFMWWLDKTRKDHSGIYQPYVKSEADNPGGMVKINAEELQQQYYENIFHTTSVDELEKNTIHKFVPVKVKRKEQVIIERFIKEEPQIKPQSSDKLDNENKAKKSSEDGDELITETLAAIYSDQMLYHKAIAAYQKLMLKFPEKSRYFADKIEQLEKKTN